MRRSLRCPVGRSGLLLILGAAGLLAACTDSRVTDPKKVPTLAESDRGQYDQFLAANWYKAFAIGPDGQFGWSGDRDNAFVAMLAALYNCNHAGDTPCSLYAVDSDYVFDRYITSATDSHEALVTVRKMAPTLKASYAGEEDDDRLPPQTVLHRGNDPGETPLAISGARRITTRYLAEQLAGPLPLLLIDVDNAGWDHETLPGALWLRGAGDDAGSKNDDVARLFAALLKNTASSKEQPIVLFCSSATCWASYNAALRAHADGYINVYWYRGGIAAWQDAGLPTVPVLPSAEFW